MPEPKKQEYIGKIIELFKQGHNAVAIREMIPEIGLTSIRRWLNSEGYRLPVGTRNTWRSHGVIY